MANRIDHDTWLRLGQAARLAEVSPRMVAYLARCGRIGTFETPLGRCYDRRDVEAYARARNRRVAMVA